MIIKDLSEFKTPEGTIPFTAQISAMLKYGFSWKKERENQENFISMIEDILNNECLLLRSVILPAREKPIPLVLITPAGLAIINPQSFTGTYQARSNVWSKLDRIGNLTPVEPNPIRETLSCTNAIRKYLEQHDHQDIPLESVLALTSMGAHVDTKHPSVRILPIDAIKNFARQIEASKPILSREEIAQFAKLITKPRPPSYSTPYPEREDSPQPPAAPPKAVQGLNSITKTLNFSKRQWILLGVILAVQILLLIVFILMVLSAA